MTIRVLTAGPETQVFLLNSEVVQLLKQGRYTQAVALAEQACEMARQHLDSGHPDLALSLTNLASAYQMVGDHARAVPLCRQGLEIRRVALGEAHPDFAHSVFILAHLTYVTGDYRESEVLAHQAATLVQRAFGDAHPHFVSCLNNLGRLYLATGEFAKAERYLRKALTIGSKSLGMYHLDVAMTLNNLASLYQLIGDHKKAEPLLCEALDIIRVTLGDGHPQSFESLNNLGVLYQSCERYSEAEAVYEQLLEARRRVSGEQHPEYAKVLNNLAELLRETGQYHRAEQIYVKALDIYLKVQGPWHPDLANTLHNAALLARSGGNCNDAETLCLKAVAIYRSAFGEKHAHLAKSLLSLSELSVATNNLDKALSLAEQAATIDNHLIEQVFSFSSQSQRTAFLKRAQSNLDVFLSLVSGYLAHSPEAVRAAHALVLRRKGITAEMEAVQRDAVLSGKYPHLQLELEQLSVLRRQIARKSLAGPGHEGLQAHEEQIAQWTQQRDRLEGEIATQIPEVSLEQKLRAADCRAVALALPHGVVLIDFVRFSVFNFKAVPARGERLRLPARYLAFVLEAGNPDGVKMNDLGEAEPIDRLVDSFRNGVARPPEERPGRDLVRRRQPEVNVSIDEVGHQLRVAVFDKLSSTCNGARQLLLSPDSTLCRLPFSLLPTEDGRLLTDEYLISYVSTSRDVLRFAPATGAGEPLIIVDPDFDLGGMLEAKQPTLPAARPGFFRRILNSLQKSPKAVPRRTSASTGQFAVKRMSRDLKEANLHFCRLPGTQAEGERVASMLGVRPWEAGNALEARLKRECRSPRILHFATHGFFLVDQEHDSGKTVWEADVVGDGRFTGRLPENPLLRSGLALAGANTFLVGGITPEDAEDGLLTAEDISGLDLSATEMVVLSACQTALGEIRIGEGVFGLQRAFTLAGAKSLIMSLWSVPDDATCQLMEEFYRRVLGGEKRTDALRNAQMEVRKKYPDPYYWGAFICQGNPGPIPQM